MATTLPTNSSPSTSIKRCEDPAFAEGFNAVTAAAIVDSVAMGSSVEGR